MRRPRCAGRCDPDNERTGGAATNGSATGGSGGGGGSGSGGSGGAGAGGTNTAGAGTGGAGEGGTGGAGGTNTVNAGTFNMSNTMTSVGQSAAGVMLATQQSGISSLVQQSVNVQANLTVR